MVKNILKSLLSLLLCTFVSFACASEETLSAGQRNTQFLLARRPLQKIAQNPDLSASEIEQILQEGQQKNAELYTLQVAHGKENRQHHQEAAEGLALCIQLGLSPSSLRRFCSATTRQEEKRYTDQLLETITAFPEIDEAYGTFAQPQATRQPCRYRHHTRTQK